MSAACSRPFTETPASASHSPCIAAAGAPAPAPSARTLPNRRHPPNPCRPERSEAPRTKIRQTPDRLHTPALVAPALSPDLDAVGAGLKQEPHLLTPRPSAITHPQSPTKPPSPKPLSSCPQQSTSDENPSNPNATFTPCSCSARLVPRASTQSGRALDKSPTFSHHGHRRSPIRNLQQSHQAPNPCRPERSGTSDENSSNPKLPSHPALVAPALAGVGRGSPTAS